MRAALSSIRSALVVGVAVLAVAAGAVVSSSLTPAAPTPGPSVLADGGGQTNDKPWD